MVTTMVKVIPCMIPSVAISAQVLSDTNRCTLLIIGGSSQLHMALVIPRQLPQDCSAWVGPDNKAAVQNVCTQTNRRFPASLPKPVAVYVNDLRRGDYRARCKTWPLTTKGTQTRLKAIVDWAYPVPVRKRPASVAVVEASSDGSCRPVRKRPASVAVAEASSDSSCHSEMYDDASSDDTTYYGWTLEEWVAWSEEQLAEYAYQRGEGS